VHFQWMRNKVLLVKPMATKVVREAKECRETCTKTPGCIAMNVKKLVTFVSCELLDKDHFERNYFLVDHDDVNYYFADVSK